MRKTIFLAVTLLSFSACHQKDGTSAPNAAQQFATAPPRGGTDVGSGGKGDEASWKEVANQLIEDLRKIQRAGIAPDDLAKIKASYESVVAATKLEFKNYPL